MNTDKNTALYEKMAAEQDKFRDWLKSQPPEEILKHTYEYTVREDILMAMEELDLPQSRAAALLASPSPLADVYKEFADRETSYMDVVRDSIEQRADAALDAQRELPLYRHDAAYAREQGDLDLYRASRRANIACKEAIEAAISEHYRDNRLDKDAVPQVIEQFGYTRCQKSDLLGGAPEENAQITRNILSGQDKGPKRQAVCLNAGAALYAAGSAETMEAGVRLAEYLIDSGRAMEKLQQFVEASNQ